MPKLALPSPYDSAALIHTNGLARLVRLLGDSAPGSSRLELPSMVGSAVRSAPAQPLVNHAVYTSAQAIPYQLPLLRSAYLRAGVRAWTLWVHQDHVPAAAATLDRCGMQYAEDIPAMMLSRRNLRRVVRPPLDYVRASGDLRTLGTVNEAAYPDGLGFAVALDGAVTDDALQVYLARSDGKVVSALLTIDQETPNGLDCGLYLVATLPTARRQGFARRLVLNALADAFERGCNSASLQASPSGEPLYAALGFTTAFHFRTFRRQEPEAPSP